MTINICWWWLITVTNQSSIVTYRNFYALIACFSLKAYLNYSYVCRKSEIPKLELIHIARLDSNMSRFFYQKKEFLMPQHVPSSLTGYVLYGFEEMAQWHAESNTSLSVNLKRWKSSSSIYMVFTHYRIVSPYHCDKGIEVSHVPEKSNL